MPSGFQSGEPTRKASPLPIMKAYGEFGSRPDRRGLPQLLDWDRQPLSGHLAEPHEEARGRAGVGVSIHGSQAGVAWVYVY